MHTDPEVTDAYNALIYGAKWWVYMPKDLLEYKDWLTCDPKCSDPATNHTTRTGVWNLHILPQLRYVYLLSILDIHGQPCGFQGIL